MTDCPWDLNGDGVVDDIDFVELAGHYGPCPGVTPPPTVITCNSPTPNFSSGCALLLYYNVQKDGVISGSDEFAASVHAGQGTITDEEYAFVQKARSAGSINALCPGCYTATTPPPPNMETRTVSLTEGQHTI